MRLFNPKQLVQSAITASDVSIYTVPADTKALVKDFMICNTTGGALTVNVHAIPSGGSVGTGNALLYAYSIAANTTYHWTGTLVIETGGALGVKGSGLGLTITVSGAEVL